MSANARIVPVGQNASAKRIATYLNDHFEGNMALAARTIDCDYTQLWFAARGVARRGPSIPVLRALAKHSGQPMEWWTAE